MQDREDMRYQKMRLGLISKVLLMYLETIVETPRQKAELDAWEAKNGQKRPHAGEDSPV